MGTVYKITIEETNQVYVGGTTNFINRFSKHTSDLNQNRHPCKELQENYNETKNLKVDILESCEDSLIQEREQFWLDYYNKLNLLINTKLKAQEINLQSNETKLLKSMNMQGKQNALGRVVSEETKSKIREAHIGMKATYESKNKMRLAKLGKPSLKKLKIIQEDLDSNFVKEWDSATTASVELNLIRNNIIKCCKGQRNKVGGFKWRYK
jgi:group I intron endonuclease